MKLTDNFSLAELTKSQTAIRLNIPNTPTPKEIERLKDLCVAVLQPVRDHFGVTIVSSGYRSLELNRALGGSRNSQHIKGEAADFEVAGVSNLEIAAWIAENLEFDQLILEGYNNKDPNSGWVHCSYSKENNRNEQLVAHFGSGRAIYALADLPSRFRRQQNKIG